jgi:iduronate 2-sulfatase
MCRGYTFRDPPTASTPAETTIAEHLKALGYATMCVGKWHLGDQPEFLPTNQGFDGYFGIPYSNDMQRKSTETGQIVHPLLRDDKVAELLTDEQQGRIVERYTDEAVRFITANKNQPFFLYLPHTAIHTPVYPGEKFRGKSANGRVGDWIEELDWSTGRILDTLRELKLAENTLVIFTSDNGPWLVKGADSGSSGPLRGGKGSTWEGGVRVPTIAWWPGKIAPNSSVDAISGTIDLLPTAVALAGGTLPAEPVIDGRDISPLLLGQTTGSPRGVQYYFSRYQLQAVRKGPWKLAIKAQNETMGRPAPPDAATDEPRLYNLDKEIGELTNVAAGHPEIVKELTALGKSIMAEIGDPAPAARRPAGKVANPAFLYPSEGRQRGGNAKQARRPKSAATAGANDRPNVLFIAVDDLRPELSAFGSAEARTPQMDRLAQRGVRFDRAYCSVPTCGASRASLMTSIRPARDRFLNHDIRASKDTPGITTLNTHFRNHGYTTISLGKIFHHPDDNAHGWSEKPWKPQAPAYVTKAALASLAKDKQGRPRGPSWENGGDVPDDTYEDGKIATQAVKKLKLLAAGGEPFFLAVGFMKPHLPFVAPGAYFDKFPAEKIKMPDNYFPPKNAPRGAVHNFGELRSYTDIPGQGILPEAKARELIRGYHASTSYTDAQIGRLLDAFDTLGLAENTIIVFWGDHGWNLGEHTLWCKHSCFETSLRVPLVIAAPKAMGLKSGESTRSLTEFIDVYPTLCDLAGLPKPGHLQGDSLVPVLKDPSSSIKDAAISRFGPGDTIRTDNFRYTIYRNAQGKETGHMLYDHENDPGENINVADDPRYAETVTALAGRLAAGMGKPGDFKKSQNP